ncbi:hypothetical protein AXX17_AT2G19500 [Arabidopsis thaliana]|uniref:F-box domain-containing protein n=1 Tax=Arabidopsis thaliana TaxID=3702 RepID=A0A178VMM5_ARATH|nr:hypothetical protein AXX17_AT2G19500 [Arabidopsis thaliana]
MDLVSSLPDELLYQILSFLNTKEAALTSILSKRWRYLIAFVSCIEIDDSANKPKRKGNRQRFMDFVDRVLALQGDSPIKKFSLKLPRECINEINRISSAFLWSGPELNPKKAKVSWDEICKPKKEGGLGLRSLREANEVSSLKLIWRLLSCQDSLWVKWTRMNLLKKESFWSIGTHSTLGSWIRRRLLKHREVAKSFCKIEVNNGVNTSFWFDNWSEKGPLINLTGARGAIEMGISRHMTLAEAWSRRRRRRHRVEILNEFEEILLQKYQHRNIELEDAILWRGKEDVFKARFSTKDTWNHIRTSSNQRAWHKGVWFAHATPKFSFCAWLAIRNRLSTGDRMMTWNNGTPTTCVFCSSPMETRDHLFFQCCYSSEIWTSIAKNVYKDRFSTKWSAVVNYISDSQPDRIQSFLSSGQFQSLLSACPVLEALDLANVRCLYRNHEIETVSSASLKNLTMKCSRVYLFDTPNLVCLNYTAFVHDNFPLVNLEYLVDAQIKLLSIRKNHVFPNLGNVRKLMHTVTNVKKLYLSPRTLGIVLGLCSHAMPVFNNLTYLAIETSVDTAWQAMPVLLKTCSHLETLVIKGGLLHCVTFDCGDACNCISREEKCRSLASFPVKRLEIREFQGQLREKNMIKHFLYYLPCLKEMDIYVKDDLPQLSSDFNLFNDLSGRPNVKIKVHGSLT